MIHGPDLDGVRSHAKLLTARHFADVMNSRGVPTAIRLVYSRKHEQAMIVLAGGTSPLISGEAELRGTDPRSLAELVAEQAAASTDEVELDRIRVNLRIDAASTESEVVAVLSSLGIDFVVDVEPIGASLL